MVVGWRLARLRARSRSPLILALRADSASRYPPPLPADSACALIQRITPARRGRRRLRAGPPFAAPATAAPRRPMPGPTMHPFARGGGAADCSIGVRAARPGQAPGPGRSRGSSSGFGSGGVRARCAPSPSGRRRLLRNRGRGRDRESAGPWGGSFEGRFVWAVGFATVGEQKTNINPVEAINRRMSPGKGEAEAAIGWERIGGEGIGAVRESDGERRDERGEPWGSGRERALGPPDFVRGVCKRSCPFGSRWAARESRSAAASWSGVEGARTEAVGGIRGKGEARGAFGGRRCGRVDEGGGGWYPPAGPVAQLVRAGDF